MHSVDHTWGRSLISGGVLWAVRESLLLEPGGFVSDYDHASCAVLTSFFTGGVLVFFKDFICYV